METFLYLEGLGGGEGGWGGGGERSWEGSLRGGSGSKCCWEESCHPCLSYGYGFLEARWKQRRKRRKGRARPIRKSREAVEIRGGGGGWGPQWVPRSEKRGKNPKMEKSILTTLIPLQNDVFRVFYMPNCEKFQKQKLLRIL